MALEFIMNADGKIDHGSGSPISGGTFVITSTPSTKVKINSSGVYVGPLLYTFSGGSASGFVDGTVQTTGPQTINATAIKVKAGGLAVMLNGDFGTMNAQGNIPPPTGGTGPVTGPVEVSDAGQDKVKGM